MSWLVEDKSWQQSRELLKVVPPQLRNETRFRRQRLVVVKKSGVPLNELDAQWDSLLRDFPDKVPLHPYRYDVLLDAKPTTEAHNVINSLRNTDSGDPYYLARLVEVRADMDRQDLQHGSSSRWPNDAN